ncbi:hypothetical protein PNP85_08535 [Halobacterium salinarum]|uniref:hypothetical protein n=1 Tax=Halobacterium salinarum TaxID=2242 RepID=UPI0025552B79|nr:hypothetical protein [Halobacterium salinarum]MDL0124725.1 hypothetical protein [Halobacterium salinarum]MDL0139549.1 hypothetical protein [Halobacterium salinarum]
MAMNRRNVLVVLGVLTVGLGVAFGSGAFSQVSAERTITADTTGDGAAYLDLSGDGEYVETTGDTVEFTFEELNQNATSTFDDTLTISLNVNDSSSAVADTYYIYFEGDNIGDSSVVDFENSTGTSLVGETQATSIQDDGTLNVQVTFDTTGSNTPVSDLDNVTIVATEDDPNA